jgi:preprotein translocase subunit Sec61beta
MVTNDQAQSVAQHWRSEGYKVRIQPRVVRAMGAAVTVYAVVVTGKNKGC